MRHPSSQLGYPVRLWVILPLVGLLFFQSSLALGGMLPAVMSGPPKPQAQADQATMPMGEMSRLSAKLGADCHDMTPPDNGGVGACHDMADCVLCHAPSVLADFYLTETALPDRVATGWQASHYESIVTPGLERPPSLHA